MGGAAAPVQPVALEVARSRLPADQEVELLHQAFNLCWIFPFQESAAFGQGGKFARFGCMRPNLTR